MRSWLSLVLLCLSPTNPSFSVQLLEVNKQWDQHFRLMKQQYEQKVAWETWEVTAELGSSAVLSTPPASRLLLPSRQL